MVMCDTMGNRQTLADCSRQKRDVGNVEAQFDEFGNTDYQDASQCLAYLSHFRVVG